MKEFRASEVDVGMRADVFIARKYPEFTRSSLEGLFENHSVSLHASPIKPSYKLRSGDRLKVDDKLLKQNPEPIDLIIIYEDKDVIVIDKPAGILTHSKGVISSESTIASFIKSKLDTDLSGNRAGIVHRLDRPTSGVIITAKNEKAMKWLQKQFSERKVKKMYLAVVEGMVEPPQAVIDAPIVRNPRKPQTFYVNTAGKPAQTEYKVIKILNKSRNPSCFVELKPLTGRTHQIRVHMAYIKHPVVGDPVYGHENSQLMLHAQKLELTLPNKERLVFESEMPKYMLEFINEHSA